MREILNWFESWAKESGESSSVKSPTLPSLKCMDDVQNMLLPFPELCRQHFADFPDGCVVPSWFTSDLIESHFCQARGLHNDNMTNPNYLTYCNTVNCIILGQSSKSRGRNSNAYIQKVSLMSFYIHSTKRKNI